MRIVYQIRRVYEQLVSGSTKGQGALCGDVVPIAGKEGGSGFGYTASRVKVPTSASDLHALSANLLDGTLNGARADMVAIGSIKRVIHALTVVSEVG
jgi:hypothetical protein